ncbi:MAG: hypothetical protein K0R57_5866 [Paenibacillaceae bacterium]|jgi:uncharacterized protein (TIGR00297 family)|nr:hypothetical protein [Paenibacillaceae bacterium]
MEWMIGAGGSLLIAGAAYWKRALTASGAVAAIVVGTCLFVFGSLLWYGLMIGFFVSSTLLTKWKKHLKKDAESKYQKSGRRDAGQVIANGGAGTILCLLYGIYPEASWLTAAYIGVMATVTADTWATEVGGLSRGQPRSILSWKKVPKGTSGGVSLLGWTASAAGGAFIGGLAYILSRLSTPLEQGGLLSDYSLVWIIPLAALAGWIGANADSVLGAAVQALYRCPVCGDVVEAKLHCGQRTELIRGWKWMDNDAVNMLSSLSGGLVLVLWSLLTG